jgi:hypothetical protein
MRLLVFVSFVGLVFSACNNGQGGHEGHDRTNGYSDKPATAVDSLYEQVMEGHDVGMAKMGKIRGYLTQTQKSLDSLGALPKTPERDAQITQLSLLKEGLGYAEYSMNTWMEEFSPDSASADESARKAYLSSEIVKVNKVKDAILTSLQKADSIFAKN